MEFMVLVGGARERRGKGEGDAFAEAEACQLLTQLPAITTPHSDRTKSIPTATYSPLSSPTQQSPDPPIPPPWQTKMLPPKRGLSRI